jgi:hypothetical protein
MSKTITAATLAATVCLVFALPAAHAGGGMGQGAGMTTCRLVLNGSQNQPQTVSVTDPLVSGDVVKVNALVLLCDLAATGVTQNASENVPSTGQPISPTDKQFVACYTVSAADTARVLTTVQDPFTEVNSAGGVAQVAVGSIALLCVPARTP